MRLNLAVLAIGDELLTGEISDTHTARIATVLGRHGYRVRRSLAVGDTEADIVEALQQLGAGHQVVIVTGGLGGTGDDLTARAAAKAFGRRLWLHEDALAQVRQRLTEMGRPVLAHHEKQALLPQKAAPLGNPVGLAPGFHLQWQETDFFFLPGVPEEMAAMLEHSLLPRLQRIDPGEPLDERRLRLFGLPESKVEERMLAVELPAGVTVGYGVAPPYVTVKLRAIGAEAPLRVDRAEAEVLRALGDYVFGRGDARLEETVAQLLTGQQLSLALAESCTGGLIACQLTRIPGASAFLDRGAVVYANRAKQHWLGVPEAVLREQGAVSRECALAMARGVRRAAESDIGLAVTGIAGPSGGSPDKPVGTVFIAMATPDGVQAKSHHFSGSRQRVQNFSAATALDWIRRYLLQRQAAL